MPWILCGAGLTSSPARVWLITGEVTGSTATARIGLPRVFLM